MGKCLKRYFANKNIQVSLLSGSYACINSNFSRYWASLLAQMVKNLPAVSETWVQPLGQEEPLEKGMVTHSNTLAWRIPSTEEPGGLQSRSSQNVGYDLVTKQQQ